MSDVREEVRTKYAEAARAAAQGSDAACCGDDCCGDVFGSSLYNGVASDVLPDKALSTSLGCGNPTAVADLHPGETVLDLGSGGGIDVLLAAQRVGREGHVYGVDMTDEMLELARSNAREAGATNVEFLKGYIEDVPLPDDSIDVAISNCVINLAADKGAVFDELRRVLRVGGRIGISDVVAADRLSPEERAERGSYVGCIAGALSFSEYRKLLESRGFENITITSTHEVTDGMHAAIVKATAS